MTSIIKQRPLWSYFVRAYALSWMLWVPLAVILNSPAETPEALSLLLIIGIWGPTRALVLFLPK
jgi:hypothetical protein